MQKHIKGAEEVKIISFTIEKDFTLDIKQNLHNDNVYGIEKKNILYIHPSYHEYSLFF